MKKKLSKIILFTLLVASSLIAQAFDDTYSLVGFEGGYSSLDVQKNSVDTPSNLEKYKMTHAGIKIGAQTDSYRLFLSTRYYGANDFDYITTYGVQLQYMIKFSPSTNFYFGVNTGIINMKFAPTAEVKYRTISDPYYGGDTGISMQLKEDIDLDFSVRVMTLDASNTIDDVTYTFDNVISAYASIIFKYKMD